MFTQYKQYASVSRILSELKNERVILSSHIDKCNKIIDTKGIEG